MGGRAAYKLLWPALVVTARHPDGAHILRVDSTGLKLCGKGRWLLEKHETATRRSWRMPHLGMDVGTGRIVAATLPPKEADDASQAGPLLDHDRVYAGVAEPYPEAGRCRPATRERHA